MRVHVRFLLLFVLAGVVCSSCAPAPIQYDVAPYVTSPGLSEEPREAPPAPAGRGRLPVAKPGPDSPSYESELDGILNGPGANDVFWGVSVKSLSTGRGIFGRNENKLFVPASNMKLFTTAVALIRLGPDFRYTTNLYTNGIVENGTLKGDVFLRGSGDPTISERFQGRPTAVFEEWADSLKQQGIREITGDLIGDDTLFDGKNLGPGWAWDDEFIAFSARISALSFNDNCFNTVISPGKRPGDPARIEVFPETSYVKIVNNVRTSIHGEQTSLDARRAFGSDTLILSGHVEMNSVPRQVRFAVGDPALYGMTVLKEVFSRKGIRVLGRATRMDDSARPPDYGSMRFLATRRSAPLSSIIEQTNKRSQNLYAELLFRTLGATYGGRGTTEKSVQVMTQSLSEMGIKPESIAIYDGSGLSRLNLVTPSQIVRVLDYMSRHRYFSYYYRSLPVAGVDGTLMKRMKNTEAENNLRAKTGTLTHVVTLSGYLKERSGGMLAFSIMSNNGLHSSAQVRSLQDAICEKLPFLLQ
jgi:D-alanyl-D-alanine carboxypeptidase/D-alanyl-D-alanine-endopeptidase (penicillin-binding protein 4)